MGSGSSALAYGFCGSVAVAATARAVCQLQKSRGHETDQWHHEGFRNGLDHARVLMQDAEGVIDDVMWNELESALDDDEIEEDEDCKVLSELAGETAAQQCAEVHRGHITKKDVSFQALFFSHRLTIEL
jgi:hypothetical protein